MRSTSLLMIIALLALLVGCDEISSSFMSEREKCQDVARNSRQAYFDYMYSCHKNGLVSSGYDDGLNCLLTKSTAGDACNEPGRFETEVRIYEECRDHRPAEIRIGMTFDDCDSLFPNE